MTTPRFDAELIRRYDRAGPRYTSYPTAVQFHAGFGNAAYLEEVRHNEERAAAAPLSLYVHIPFCASPCFYCACNRIITRSRDRATAYLARLFREIELQGQLFHRTRTVEQLHFGGGTPTFLCADELGAVIGHLRRHFSLTSAGQREYSIEIDPRTVDRACVQALAGMGFNRMSLGIQDFDPAVQRAINRIQPVSETLQIVAAARDAGIGSISFDLIYGLPRQTPAGFEHTLDAVLRARPDRLAVYAYAHMPQLFKAQRRLSAQDLPTPEVRLELLGLTVKRLTAAGYVYIGMDHFALPDDELVRAKAKRTLHRNFQGYSTRAYCDLVGLGVSAISKVGNVYAQNCKLLPDYYAAIDAGHLAVQRGVRLNEDDRVRAAVIQALMCHESVDTVAIEREFGIDFRRYFSRELDVFRKLEADGLAWSCGTYLGITARGRLLMRNVAMTFDAHATRESLVPAFSRVI